MLGEWKYDCVTDGGNANWGHCVVFEYVLGATLYVWFPCFDVDGSE